MEVKALLGDGFYGFYHDIRQSAPWVLLLIFTNFFWYPEFLSFRKCNMVTGEEGAYTLHYLLRMIQVVGWSSSWIDGLVVLLVIVIRVDC